MTYKDEVLADGPYVYLTLDGGDITNQGSMSGAISAGSGGISYNETPAGAMAGNSAYFPGGANAYILADNSLSITNWTWEAWYKHDTTQADYTRQLFRISVGTYNYIQITLNTNNGYFRVYDYSGINDGVINTTIVDGDWHHLAVVKSGSRFTFYLDGVELGNVSGTSGSKAGKLYFGGHTTANTGSAGWMDEIAFYYNNSLSSERIAAHFDAASAPPVTDINVAAPAMAVNVSAPAPVTRVTVTGAMTLSLETATPQVSISRAIYRSSIRRNGGPSATFDSVAYGAPLGYSFSNFSLPAGYEVVSATLRLSAALSDGPTVWFGVANNYASGTSNANELTDVNGVSFGTADAKGFSSHVLAVGTQDIDLTSLVNSSDFTTHENIVLFTRGGTEGASLDFDSTNPKLTYSIRAKPPATVHATATPMTISLSMPQHRFGVGTKSTVVGAGSAAVEMSDATISVTRNVLTEAPATTLTMQFFGGESRNPDQWIKATPFEMWIFSPNANGYGGTDGGGVVEGVMELSLSGTDNTMVDLRTDRKAYVIGPMSVTVKMVGIYFREADRYFKYLPNTIDSDDMWLPMDEVSGTVAIDHAIGYDSGTGGEIHRHNAEYVGNPTLQAEGPHLRKAVAFDGVDDRVELDDTPYAGAFAASDMTIEFAIRTTQLDGTLVDGGARYQTQTTGVVGGGGRAEIRLENGYITLVNQPENDTYRYKVDKFVADGEWHHVVISLPMSSMHWDAYNISRYPQHFVMIDGDIEWARYQHGFGGLLPQTLMARTYDRVNYDNFLKGSMSSFVFRLNRALDSSTARKLYYEWSNATLANPEPMTVSLAMKDPARARGNVKRMIAIYGLPYGIDDGVRNGVAIRTRDGWGNYYSMFAGYYIKNAPYQVSTPTGTADINFSDISWASNGEMLRYLPVKPFMLEGYMVYPLAIHKLEGSNGGPFSAPGMENGKHIDPWSKVYVDDETGLPRFVNLQKDLVEDVTDFDAITVVNYPAPRPEDGGNVSSSAIRQPRQHNIGLTNYQWTQARDALRDSIMEAAYNGVSLWITEPEMALHCGFIQGYDIHETGARVEFFGPGNVDATGYTNTRAYELDVAHGVGGEQPAQGNGQFNFTWQANAKRKIINLEEGLTDLPGWFATERISWEDDDPYIPYARWTATDVIDRMGGLQVGDELLMDMWEQNSYTGNYPQQSWAVGIPRKFIVSAKPQGIAGKPISKEMDFYYGPYGVVRQNPWRDNIYTIAAEAGTVVRGRSIGGRAFIEFMDTEITEVKVAIDKDPTMWRGRTGQSVSTWSYDTRRYKEIVAIFYHNKSRSRTMPNGDVIITPTTIEQRFMEIEHPDLDYKPFMSMNARGLNWIAKASTVPTGDVRAFTPAMEISLSGTEVKISRTRNMVAKLTGAAQVHMELRQPRNFRDGEVRERTLPMRLDLEMRGIGRVTKVPPMVVDLAMSDSRVVGSGDKIYVYMDANRTITLFIKEDS